MAGRGRISLTEQHEPTTESDLMAGLELVGGRVCLDFVNTVDPRESPADGTHRQDYLASYADLVKWSRHASLLSEERMVALLNIAARHHSAARAVFERAVALREALYRVFSSIAAGQDPDPGDLASVQSTYLEALAQAHLIPTSTGFDWQRTAQDTRLDQMLWPIIHSTMELLTAPEVRRVRICPGLGDCGWLFLDSSKSGRRRWCSMESCGSRSKMRRYYARSHPSSPLT